MKNKDFIDIHTHGIGKYDTMTDNPDDILKIARAHARAGSSAILPAVYSGPIGQMRKNIAAIKKAMRAQQQRPAASRQQSTILGTHLEGPFLNPLRCGAQDRDSFIKPSISNLKKLIDGYKDIIKVITIAPELPGALKVIEKCVSLGIKVNMGHSEAKYRQALEGKKAGATGITHIFNAMRPFHHREPGLAGFGLLDEDLYIEVIADNVHIKKMSLKLIFKVKRLDRIILISDSVKGVKDKKGRIYSAPGVLAGSSITLADAVKNTVDSGIPEAVAAEAAIDNPKRYLTV